MNISYLLGRRLAVGEGIWAPDRMAELARLGFTHIVDVDEFDDTALADAEGLKVLWNPVGDDQESKPPEFFERSVQFAQAALSHERHAVYVHCAAGIHRGPLAASAIVAAIVGSVDDAIELVQAHHPAAEFPSVYVKSLRAWMAARTGTETSKRRGRGRAAEAAP